MTPDEAIKEMGILPDEQDTFNTAPNELLIQEFENLLSDKSTDENDVQRYLEEHSELIPLPILEGHQLHESVVISKLPIGNKFISDFAYLTKCSDRWRLVLMEIENPHKKIFTSDYQNHTTTSDFKNAYQQILSWKNYISQNLHIIKESIYHLMSPEIMKYYPLEVSYVLIIGRNKEKNMSPDRSAIFSNFGNSEDMTFKTYDSIISEYRNRKTPIQKIILSPWKNNSFSIKLVPTVPVETWIFSYLTQDNLKVSEPQRSQLIDQGYRLDLWECGNLLTEDGKYDKQTKISMLPVGHPYRKILESELKLSK